jgi:hypothetical protein
MMYGMELVGGPYDGEQDLAVITDDPPRRIMVGMCSGGDCEAMDRRTGMPCAREHVWFWFVTEAPRNLRLAPYLRVEVVLGAGQGRATYLHSDVHAPSYIEMRSATTIAYG